MTFQGGTIQGGPHSVLVGPLSDPEERRVIFAALDSFRRAEYKYNLVRVAKASCSQYRNSSHYNTTHRRRQNLYALPKHHWELLASVPFNLLETFSAIDDAIDCNADIADAILELGLQSFGLPDRPVKGTDLYWHGHAKPGDMAKAHSTIRQFYRDWSTVGFAAETKPILDLVLSDLSSTLPLPSTQDSLNILMPGAGLGRLLFELAMAGYMVEGNEISYHQLLASNFVLNATERQNQFKLYPFANTFTNNLDRQNQLKEVLIPDIHPSTAFAEQSQKASQGLSVMGQMNMAAGDFLTSYAGSESEQIFNAVVSVYFIDTAPNLIRYIETVRHCLKDEGVWINIGPLLWHFDDRRVGQDQTTAEERNISDNKTASNEDAGIGEPGSFELTDQEVIALVGRMGFTIIQHDLLSEGLGGYIQDPDSMIQNRYRCSHWIARKTNLSAN